MMLVNEEKCVGCGLCVKDCLLGCIKIKENKAKIRNLTCFKCGHCIAVCPKNAVYSDEYDMGEVKEYIEDNFKINSENLLNFMKFRRTTRQFDVSKEVEVEKIEKIIEAGRYAPTSSNMQNVSYIVVKDNIQKLRGLALETLNKLGENILKSDNLEHKKYKAYAKMWMKMYNDFKANKENSDKLLFNSSSLIFVLSDSDVNASLASSNMELITNALGLGTFFSGFSIVAAKDNKPILDLLGINSSDELLSCLVIGYPDVKYKRTVPRKDAVINWI